MLLRCELRGGFQCQGILLFYDRVFLDDASDFAAPHDDDAARRDVVPTHATVFVGWAAEVGSPVPWQTLPTVTAEAMTTQCDVSLCAVVVLAANAADGNSANGA